MAKLILKDISLQAGIFKVKNINLRIENNQYFALMGHTGSGKSMLLQAICGLMKVQKGVILMNNKDITNLEPRFRNVGYVPQNSGLFPHLKVKDNIIFSLRLKGLSKKDAICEVSNIIDFLDIAYLLDRSVINLSGGEKQKVALARGLAKKPSLLLLDEPVSALDELTKFEICNILKDIQKEFKISTIHVCHNLQESKQIADSIGIMSNGELIKTGTLSELTQIQDNKIIQNIITPGR